MCGGITLTSKITLRPAEDSDKTLLHMIYARSREEELAVTGWSDDQKKAFLEMQFNAQRTDYTRRFPEAEQSVIRVDSIPVGRIWVNRGDSEIRLLDIIILPEYQNSGTGKLLLEQLIDEARKTGKKLRHSVYKDNMDAIRFYQRLGFTTIEEHELYIVMEWTGEVSLE